jgi:arylsulfatase A-like enzyme/HEAT repeat protein
MDAVPTQHERTGSALPAASSLGALLGALAGLWSALADFGASWLWLPVWRDRAGLLWRLVATLPPVGALLGALLAALALFSWRFAERRGRLGLAPLPVVLLAVVPLHVLALKLCSGGMMSRLAQRRVVEWALSLLLPLLLYGVLWLAARTAQRLLRGQLPVRIVAAIALAVAFALGKINETFLPNLYEYLHAALAVVTWLVALAGLWVLALDARFRPWVARWTSLPRAALLPVALSCAFLLSTLTLNANLNVRVAMFDARAPSSRAFLAGADPLLRRLDGPQAARGTKGLYRGAIDTTGLPTQEGAHVVLITIDALRADHLGVSGYKRPVSPGIDAFAREATLFERAYAQAPHSSYSLSSLHTSEYLHEVVELGRPLPEATLATAFKQHGYHTAAFFTDGIFHTEGQKLSLYRDGAFGYALFDHTNFESEAHTDRVLREVDRIKGQGEPPSFLWVHYFDVHEPYQETTFGTGEMDRYDSEIAHVDRELTRLVKELDARFDREVIVAISADHGEEFRDHGGVYHGSTLYDEQVRVPLIIRAAGLPKKRLDKPVEVIDIAPTLLGLAGAKVPESMRGRDLRAYAMGRTGDPGPVFSAVLTKRMALRWPLKLIADLRFGLYELYDLERDPGERHNLAGRDAARLAEMRELVYAWLDSLEHQPGAVVADGDEWSKALRWGRLGDRRAVEPMTRLVLDTGAPTAMRIEAGQILAKLADESSADALVRGMATTPSEVAAEAAIALGRMYDPRARTALTRLVQVEDPYLRARAAISLGRLRERAAVPALIEALWVAPTQYEREEAVRWLGRLRDTRAVEPLLSLLPEFNLRYLLAVALGQIGDPRAYPALAEMLEWEAHMNIRDEVVRGLGILGDPRIIEPLVRVLAGEPALKNTGESLVRLGALERGYVGGVDLNAATKGASGFERCQAGPLFHDWDYVGRTFCVSRGREVQLKLPLPTAHARWNAGAELIVRVRRTDGDEPVALALTLSGKPLATVRAEASFTEQRVPVEPEALRHGALKLGIVAGDAAARFAIDHALLVPRADALLSSRTESRASPLVGSGEPKAPADASAVP